MHTIQNAPCILAASTISMVMPAYTEEQCWLETVESVLAQSHSADESVIVEDSFQEATLSTAQSFGYHVPVVRKANVRITGACNTGIREAIRKWIALPDDSTKLDNLARQLIISQSRPGLQVVYCPSEYLLADCSTEMPPAFPTRELWPATCYRASILPSLSVTTRKSALRSPKGSLHGK